MSAPRPIPRPPAAVLFDMDGVLVDTFAAWVGVLDECRARRGLTPLGPEPVRACWGQGLQADCATLFPGTDPQALAREYEAGFGKRLALVRAEPEARDTVAALHVAGVPLAVVTNSPAGLARSILQRIGCSAAFTVVAGGDEAPQGKPAPDIVQLALARLHCPAAQCALVGDTALDVAAARAAGVPVIGYRIDGDARVERLTELLSLFGLSSAR